MSKLPPLTNWLLAGCLLATSLSAAALEFRSVARHGAILYDTPASSGKRLFVAGRGLPLEVLVEQKDWLRVRDQSGKLAWIATKDLSAQRYVQVLRAGQVLREGRNGGAILFRTERGLLLQLLENNGSGWVKIKHRDGQSGYIRIEDVWGL